MQCKQAGCEEEARYTVLHWPGQATEQCEKHTAKLFDVAKHLGLTISATLLPVVIEES